MKPLVFTLLAVLFLAAVLLNRAYRSLPLAELRRRARSRQDKPATSIYKAAAYGEALEILLWLVGSLSASFLVLAAADSGRWLLTLLILIAGFFIFAGVNFRPMPGWQWSAAAWAAVPTAWLLSFLEPVFRPLGNFLAGARPAHRHSRLYEKEDLLGLLKRQAGQGDSRFSAAELSIAHGALSFGDKAVGQVMTPRAKLKMVAINDPIGPHIMDELHASGLSSFPVVKENTRAASPEIIGTLYLSDLVDHGDSGKIRDVIKHKVYYINEAQNLREALGAFIKTEAHMLIVVNNFEEIAGALTIEQVLRQIMGKQIASEFDRYDDLSAVAGLQKTTLEDEGPKQ